MGQRAHIRWLRGLAGAAVTSLSLCGCAGFWDEVTSRDFKFKKLFEKPSPLVVLRDSNDGDERAQALRALREPKQYKGTDKEQDAIVNILVTAATSDAQPICRLAAIDSLGHFKDPRAADGLINAYYNAGSFPRQRRADQGMNEAILAAGTVPADIPTRIRCQALTALGETGNPKAIRTLTLAVREPPAVGPDEDKEQALDVRLAAARALAKFHQPEATDALVSVLQSERDVALRERAYESLEASTGKKLPPDAKAWQEALHPSETQGPRLASEPKKGLLGWF